MTGLELGMSRSEDRHPERQCLGVGRLLQEVLKLMKHNVISMRFGGLVTDNRTGIGHIYKGLSAW